MKVEVEITGNGVEAVVFIDGQMRNCEIKTEKAEKAKVNYDAEFLKACGYEDVDKALKLKNEVSSEDTREGCLHGCQGWTCQGRFYAFDW